MSVEKERLEIKKKVFEHMWHKTLRRTYRIRFIQPM